MLFILPFKCSSESKIRINQLKILHRFYPCQSLVSKWDKEKSEICSSCKKEKDTITHMFYKCHTVNKFWKELIEFLDIDILPTLSLTQVLFGILPYTLSNHSINHLLLHCKYFIHLQKTQNIIPNLERFKHHYESCLKVEEEVYRLENNSPLYDKLFSNIKCKIGSNKATIF